MSFGKIWPKNINYSNLKQISIAKKSLIVRSDQRDLNFATKFNNQHKITRVETEKKKKKKKK
jgi:hypothetical protein